VNGELKQRPFQKEFVPLWQTSPPPHPTVICFQNEKLIQFPLLEERELRFKFEYK
jgi:hypothetical protein